MGSVLIFEPDGSVVPIAGRLPPDAPVTVGHPLPAARAAYLRESATGPWIDEWTPGRSDDDYTRRWLEKGLSSSAYVPFGGGGKVYGLLAAGTNARVGVDTVTRWLPSLAEYAAVAGALLIPALTGRRATADLAGPIRRAIDERGFVPHFQPVVELESRSVVGYEALTRFNDGTPPERRFADADQVGLGQDLELACLHAAMKAGKRLPAGRWLSLNVSHWLLSKLADPSVLADPGPERALPQAAADAAGAVRRGASARSRRPRSSWALAATMMVEALITRAPTLIGSRTPQGARTPAATGMASAL